MEFLLSQVTLKAEGLPGRRTLGSGPEDFSSICGNNMRVTPSSIKLFTLNPIKYVPINNLS